MNMTILTQRLYFGKMSLKRFRAKWIPVRVKKTRQNKKLERGSDSIRTEKALAFALAIVRRGL
jgi:hypothetical protein